MMARATSTRTNIARRQSPISCSLTRRASACALALTVRALRDTSSPSAPSSVSNVPNVYSSAAARVANEVSALNAASTTAIACCA